MNVRELHARLGELLAENGDDEVVHVRASEPVQLYRITSAGYRKTTGNAHSWPSFVQLGDKRWDDADWPPLKG